MLTNGVNKFQIIWNNNGLFFVWMYANFQAQFKRFTKKKLEMGKFLFKLESTIISVWILYDLPS